MQKRWAKARPDLIAALAAVVKKVPVKPGSRIWKAALNLVRIDREHAGHFGTVQTAETLVRLLAFASAAHESRGTWFGSRQDFTAELKGWGIDAMAIVNQVAPAEHPKVQTSAKPGKPVKGTCRKCGCTVEKACAGGCGWMGKDETRCTACFAAKAASSRAKRPAGKKKARR